MQKSQEKILKWHLEDFARLGLGMFDMTRFRQPILLKGQTADFDRLQDGSAFSELMSNELKKMNFKRSSSIKFFFFFSCGTSCDNLDN